MIQHRQRTFLGDIPGEWGEVTVGDCLLFHQAGDWGDDRNEVELKVLRSTNFSSTTHLKLEDVAVRGFPTSQAAKFDLRQGDILVERSGGGPTQPVGRVVALEKDMPGYGFSNFVQMLRPNPEIIDPDYFAWCLFQLHCSGQIERLQHQTTQMRNLDFRDYLRVKLPQPPKSEQKRIGQALHQADVAVSAARLELESTHSTKKALLQTLFSRGIPGRHSEFQEIELFRRKSSIPTTWNFEHLGQSLSSIEYGTNAPSNDGKYGFPVIGIPQMTDSVLKVQDWPHTEIPVTEAKQLRLEAEDVLIIRTNGNPEYIAKSTLVTKEVAASHIVYASYLIRLRPKSNLLRGAYLNYFLAAPEGRRQALACSNTSAGNHNLGARAIKRFQLPRPSIEEQDLIIQSIESAEAAITAAESNTAALERLKQSLLQNLLTGRLRVRS